MADQKPKYNPTGKVAVREGGKLLPIETEMLARAIGQQPTLNPQPSWFGSGEPMAPQAPENVRGRRFDYPFAVNVTPRPRAEMGENAIDFQTLRRVADPTQGGLDMLRLAIETVKDDLARLQWDIVGLDGKGGGDKAKRIKDLLQEPDGVNDFGSWIRMILDDSLVLDQPVIYLRPTTRGYKLPELIDGATIKRIVSDTGRVPLPPLPAFAQQLKGLPAVEYTLDELIVRPYNPRTHRIYPLGPTEQVVNIVNLWLRRIMHQTQFYSEGSIPDALLVGPEGLNPDQLADFQTDWDTVLAGESGQRRHGKWVPFGTQFVPTKEPDLKDEMDEWLARVICWAFSLSPSALVKDNNRATSETNKSTAQQQGLEPRKRWLKGLMDAVLRRAYGVIDLQFAWQDEGIPDPLVKMRVWTGYKTAQCVTADEVREKALGMEKMTEEQRAEVAPPPALGMTQGDEPGKPGSSGPGATPQGKGFGSASGPSPAKKPAVKPDEPAKAQKKKSLRPIKRTRAAIKRNEKRIKRTMGAYFKTVEGLLVASLRSEKVAKGDKTTLIQVLGTVPKEARADLEQELLESLEEMAQDGAEAAIRQVMVLQDASEEDILALLDQANVKAIEWAAEHAGELITAIDETTRDQVGGLVERAMTEGWSNDELASAIEDGETFSAYRAEMIARTETAFADTNGNIAGWNETGVVEGVEWSIAQDEFCEDCQSLDGKVVPMGGFFTSEDGETAEGPPLHPNCRCTLLPVLMDPNEDPED